MGEWDLKKAYTLHEICLSRRATGDADGARYGRARPRKLLASVVRRLLQGSRSETADDHEERDDARESESNPDRNGA